MGFNEIIFQLFLDRIKISIPSEKMILEYGHEFESLCLEMVIDNQTGGIPRGL